MRRRSSFEELRRTTDAYQVVMQLSRSAVAMLVVPVPVVALPVVAPDTSETSFFNRTLESRPLRSDAASYQVSRRSLPQTATIPSRQINKSPGGRGATPDTH